MSGIKKIKVCKKCSDFDVNELKGNVFGLIKGNFAVCNTKEKFLEKADAIG
jgi:hypothetical protein